MNLLLWLGLLTAAGCGGGHSGAAVSGQVLVRGQPLADIGVSFQPIGEGYGSTGQTDAQGHYTLSFSDSHQPGAVIGRHQVTFTDLLDKPEKESDGGPAPPSKSRLPPAVRTQIHEFEVPPHGTTAANFELK